MSLGMWWSVEEVGSCVSCHAQVDAEFSRPMASGLHCVFGIYEVVSANNGAEISLLRDIRRHHVSQLYDSLALADDERSRHKWWCKSKGGNHVDDSCFIIRARF